jgi:hypothetical protein
LSKWDPSAEIIYTNKIVKLQKWKQVKKKIEIENKSVTCETILNLSHILGDIKRWRSNREEQSKIFEEMMLKYSCSSIQSMNA